MEGGVEGDTIAKVAWRTFLPLCHSGSQISQMYRTKKKKKKKNIKLTILRDFIPSDANIKIVFYSFS